MTSVNKLSPDGAFYPQIQGMDGGFEFGVSVTQVRGFKDRLSGYQ